MVSTYVPNSYGDMVEIVEDYPEGYVMHSDYAALEARVAGLERDAARYRWLRNQNNREIGARILRNKMDASSAIDKAIEESK